MLRVLAVSAACLLLLLTGVARAEGIETSVRQLGTDSSQRARLAAALSLSKSKDARAVIALAGALGKDDDIAIRRISALALEKMIDPSTAPDAIVLALAALDEAAVRDSNARVRETAAKALQTLASLRPKKKGKIEPRGNKPAVFVNIDPTLDQSKKLPPGDGLRLTNIVKASVDRTGYATSWPGGLPTGAELTSSRTRAFIVASTVKKVQITKVGGQMEIACTVAVRVSPWSGKDGGERWEANKAASASGSAKAMTGSRERDIQTGVRDCLEAVAEDVTSRQVVPFLKRIASAGS